MFRKDITDIPQGPLDERNNFFAYLILGILVTNGLRSNGITGFKGFRLALLICVLYAISDEVHQLLIFKYIIKFQIIKGL